MNLSDRALLVQLSISQWTARKYDRKTSADVARTHNATLDAGRYNKHLLPMADLLENIHKKSSAIRDKFYANTLPWGVAGQQILPTPNYLGFMADFRKERDEWNSLVRLFVDNYPALRDFAKQRLGGLYDPTDYPHENEIRAKFHMDMAVYPVPTSDFRVSIASAELERIQQDVAKRVEQAQQAAMQDLWQRIYDRVKHMAEKLADPKAIFRDTLVENIREQCSMLTRLNFADDANLEAMRQQIEGSLIHHPDALRNDPDLRRDTAAEAKAIMDRMAVFMGV